MHHTQTNVKFKMSTILRATEPELGGVPYPSDVAVGTEGTLRSLTQRNQKQAMGPIPQMLQGATMCLDVKPTTYYDAVEETYRDDIQTYLKDGIFLSITHQRNGRTNGWKTLATPIQYEVTFIHDADGVGDVTLYLKTRGAS
jgi:hypothetical protein